MAGWNGLFSIEKSEDAFATFKSNLCTDEGRFRFQWPAWLPCEAMTTSLLLESYRTRLESLKGHVDLIAGGPPCQGFSTLRTKNGARRPRDSQNDLIFQFQRLVLLLKPKQVMLENVPGLLKNSRMTSFKRTLRRAGYKVRARILNVADDGDAISQFREVSARYGTFRGDDSAISRFFARCSRRRSRHNCW